MIKISGLIFDYPGKRALDNISLSVAAGSVTALVGPNGAGKTTLLRCIAGLETPLSGSIHVADMDVIEKPREVHRLMGYLSDFFGLYQELTVAQCLEYAAAAQGLPSGHIAAAIRQTAQQLDLVDQLHKPSGSLSRGQRQRVAIGQAIIHQPKVLLLDEPASGLDPEARSGLAALFRQLQANGMTLLVSSHILAELDEYSTHLLSVRDGRVLENRALATSHHVSGERRIRLTLVHPDTRIESWLLEQTAVTLASAQDNAFEITLSGDLNDQAALLQQLIAAGFKVASFAEHKENLQQSYLRAVATHLESQQ